MEDIVALEYYDISESELEKIQDFCTIVLNSRASHEANKITLEHELSHIANNDFHKCQTVTLLEAIRHKRG